MTPSDSQGAGIVLAMTGASGAPYAVELLRTLSRAGRTVHLTISPSGAQVLREEMDLDVSLQRFDPAPFGELGPGRVVYHHHADFKAGIASGSFPTAGMVVSPCSMSTLGAIAHGITTNLVTRAADVHLKERRKLVLVPRETPLSLIHLENMAGVTRAGAVVLPAMPGWYHRPNSLEDLVRFLERADVPPVAQAAIAHAQFETIHPFVDGNGRVGRCLIQIVLRRTGVAPRFVPPVSIVLAAHPTSYVGGLVNFREGRVADWIESFADACLTAATDAANLANEVSSLQRDWFERAGRPRADSAAAKLIALLPSQPVVSAPTIRTGIGTSQQQALAGLKALADAGVVRQISAGTYDRQFAAIELLDLVTAFEGRIAGL